MQLLPETAATVAHEMGIRLEDGDLKSGPRAASRSARTTCTICSCAPTDRFRSRWRRYNAGEDSVLRWAERMKGMELDAFVEAIPFVETRGYVVKVMENFARYGFLERGEEGVPKIELSLK